MSLYPSHTTFGLLLCLTVTLFCGCSTQTKEQGDLLKKKQQPYDHFFKVRSYPNPHPDERAVREGFESAKLHRTKERDNGPFWQLEGPQNIGGRINAVAIHPDNELIMLAGNTTGGVFKTVNGGADWYPVTDDIEHLPIAHIVYHPTDPNQLLLGTGDPNISGFPFPGGGVYRSGDGGESWTFTGLEETKIVSKVAFDPQTPTTLWAATMGVPFERTTDRGLYKSTDSGASWQQSLYIDNETGISDLRVNPEQPDTLFAAGWTRIRNNEESLITGEKTRIYRSFDGGQSWDTLTVGLPEGPQSRIGLEMSRNDPNTLWALFVGTDYSVEGIYKTTDAGNTWTNLYDGISLEGALGGFGWYFAKIRVNPWNEEEISILGVDLWTSFDDGTNWSMTTPPWWEYAVHADKHDMVYLGEENVVLATDGGLYQTTNGFTTWQDIDNIPNTQFYRIGLDPFNSDQFTGGAQDNGTTTGSQLATEAWTRDYGGDGFQPIHDYENPGLTYMETQNGGLVYSDNGFISGFTQGIDEEDRRNWDMPIIQSPHESEHLFTGTYRVYQILNAPFGSWFPISEDLTDGNIFGESFHTISSVALSPINPNLLYAGTTDGNVWRGESDGLNWEWTSLHPGSVLPDRWVTNIKASDQVEDRVWVTFSGYRQNDQETHLYRSDDTGETWMPVNGDMPAQPLNHLETLKDSIIFAAADYGVYYSENSGENWSRIGTNMPLIPVFDIEIDTVNHRLVAGTFARGIYTYPLDSLFTWPEDAPEPVGTAELQSQRPLLYPNPTNDFVVIEDMEGANLRIYDHSGRCVLTKSSLTAKDRVSLESLESGKYVMVFEQQGRRLTENVVVF